MIPAKSDIFTAEKIKDYEQIIIFVQKGNDLDTCAGALAVAKIIENKFPDKYCKIAGVNKLNNTLLKDINKYTVIGPGRYRDNKHTLGILIDINSPTQISQKELFIFCTHFLIIDHHLSNEMDEVFEESFTSRIICNHRYPEYSSACEIIWTLLKRNKWNITTEIAETLFMGLYADNQDFIAQTTNSTTFRIVGEMMDKGTDVKKLIKLFRQRELKHIQVFADLIERGTHKNGNLLLLNLTPDRVHRYFKWNFYRLPDGKIRQKKLFTFPLVLAQQNIQANTYIFVHYSLFKPFEGGEKFIFVVVEKENEELENLLRENNFKRHRNRWSKKWTLENLLGLVQKHKEIFTR